MNKIISFIIATAIVFMLYVTAIGLWAMAGATTPPVPKNGMHLLQVNEGLTLKVSGVPYQLVLVGVPRDLKHYLHIQKMLDSGRLAKPTFVRIFGDRNEPIREACISGPRGISIAHQVRASLGWRYEPIVRCGETHDVTATASGGLNEPYQDIWLDQLEEG